MLIITIPKNSKKWKKFLRHYSAFPNMFLVLELVSDEYLTFPSQTSIEDLIDHLRSIHNEELVLIQAIPKGFVQQTIDKFSHYYPMSLIIFLLPAALIVASFNIKVPEKKKKA
jgi:hypothetical protein